MKEQKVITQEEAIKRLKESRFTIQPYKYMNQALDIAISALEKQIPKKAKFNFNLNDRTSSYRCNCGKWLKVRHDCGTFNNNNVPNYCPECGQRLDWSD